MRVLILHGWQGNDEGHWQGWLAEALRQDGVTVRSPQLPQCDEPCPQRWGAALHAELSELAAGPGDGERVVVCHSLACVLWLRECAAVAAELRPDRAVLVAPPCPGADVPELEGFYPCAPTAAQVAAAARVTRLVCSDDDPYCPGRGAAAVWAQPCGIAADVLPGARHLNVESGYGPWPAMRDWVLGVRADLRAQPAAA